MSFVRDEPFIWIHLAGIVTLPVSLGLVWLGLSLGQPLPLAYGEFIAIAIFGIFPVLWMQLVRPFNIFSILFVSLYPQSLSDKQRQILALFKTKSHRWLSVMAAGSTIVMLWSIYFVAPQANLSFSWLPQWRWLSLAISCLAFLSSNLFLQVPLAVLRILTIDSTRLAAISPHPVEQIEEDFTSFGWRVDRILPFSTVSAQSSENKSE
jgi:hypothetical protein